MFLKIVKIAEDGQRISSLYECHRVHIHYRHESEPLSFDLDTNSNELDPGGNVNITVDFPYAATIYIMSSEGKTVDTVEYKPKPPKP